MNTQVYRLYLKWIVFHVNSIYLELGSFIQWNLLFYPISQSQSFHEVTPFRVNVIIDMVGFISTILVLFSIYFISSLLFFILFLPAFA